MAVPGLLWRSIHHEGHEGTKPEKEFNRKERKERKKDLGATGWSPCFPIPLLRGLSASALKTVADQP